MSKKIDVKFSPNGKIVSVNGKKFVSQNNDDTIREVENFAEMLRSITEECGMAGSRYSDRRIYIVTAPGDKNESFGVGECQLCLREYPKRKRKIK